MVVWFSRCAKLALRNEALLPTLAFPLVSAEEQTRLSPIKTFVTVSIGALLTRHELSGLDFKYLELFLVSFLDTGCPLSLYR